MPLTSIPVLPAPIFKLFRPMLRHSFWRKTFSSIGPRFVVCEAQDKRFYCDLKEGMGPGRALIKYGEHDPYVTFLIHQFLSESDVFIDIGANIGYYAVVASGITRAPIYAFEPEPFAYGLLQRNIELNQIKNVTAVDKAICEKDKKLKLYLNEFNHGDHRCFESEDNKRSAIEIDGITLDNYMRENSDTKNIKLIKIDVQGYELNVLQGMQQILQDNEDITVISEYEPGLMLAAGYQPEVFIREFSKLDFNCYFLDEKAHAAILADTTFLAEKAKTIQTLNLLFSRQDLDTNKLGNPKHK